MIIRQFSRPFCIGLGIAALSLLTACNSGNYQAPITDHSEDSGRKPVEIVTTSDDRPSRYIGASNYGASSTRAAVSRAPAFHTVARGESLYSIAFQYDLDFRSLAMINNLNPPYTIFTGQQLSLDSNAPRSSTMIGAEGAVISTGVVVSNNSVARAQAASNSVSGVSRQPIVRAPASAPAAAPVAPTHISVNSNSAEPQWQWPIQGRILKNFQATSGVEKGIDIAGLNGQYVGAAADGDVVYAGNGIQGSGNLIIIRHSERFLSAYAQNRTLLVNEGDQIRAGDRIAEVGSNPDGAAMLHFEIRMDGAPVDPIRYLPRL